MELRHLRYFLAAADALHFGKAARRLHVSQPALSQQMQALEGELGAPLFERLRGGVRLTQAGEVFRGYAARAVEDAHQGQRAVAALGELSAGRLRVGYLPSFRGLVAPALASVVRPGVRVRVEEAVASRVERRVAEGKLDVGLSYAPVRSPEVEAEPLGDSLLGLVVGKRHALRGEARVPLERLADEPFALLSPGLRARSAVDAYFLHERFSPRVIFEANSVAAVLSIVAEGLAVTVLPEPSFSGAERLPILRLLPAPAAQLAVLIFRRGAPRAPAAEALAQALRAAMNP